MHYNVFVKDPISLLFAPTALYCNVLSECDSNSFNHSQKVCQNESNYK